MTDGTMPQDELQQKLAQLSPERRALVERMLRARAGGAPASAAAEPKETGIPRRVDSSRAPMSAIQRFLWLLTQATPGLYAYNAPRAYRLHGELDVYALQAALNGLVARHEVFRTRFVPEGDEAIQVIDAPSTVPLVMRDLTTVARDEREADVERLLGEASRVPFEIDRDLMLRAELLRLADDEHVLLLVSHHSASDGWSRNVMFRELAELYAAARANRAPSLPPVAVQYGDYAAWQEARIREDGIAGQLGYWRDKLAGAPSMLELPTDYPRSAAPSFAGLRRHTVIDARTRAQLERVGASSGASLFMVMLAAHATLLHRYTGQSDLVIGTPVAGRTHPDLEHVIGYLANSLPIRVSVDGDPSFEELVGRVRAACLEAYDRQELPFEVLALEVQRARATSHAPIFQSMFTLHDQNPVELSLDGLRVEPIAFETGWAKLDLVLDAGQRSDGTLQVALNARADLFAPETIERMLSHVRTLLESIAVNPAQPVSELAIMPAAERKLVVETWNATQGPYPSHATLHGLIAETALRRPDAVALEWEESNGVIGRMTFATLLDESQRLADRLRAHGAHPGRGVGLCLERSPALVIGMLGAMITGAHYVPFDPAYPPERLAFMLDDANAPVMVLHGATRERADAFLALAATNPELIDLDAPAPAIAADDVVESADATPDDLAYVIYTSGSTGRPKGVMIPHRAVVNYVAWMQSAYPLAADDAVLQKAPASFDACIWEFFLPLVAGARMVLARPGGHQDPEYLLDALEKHDVSILQLVPVQLRMMFELPGTNVSGALNSLRHLFLGGEALPGELLSDLRSRCPTLSVTNLYGPTEATVYATSWDAPSGPWNAVNVPVGRPMTNVSVFIVDRHLRPVPIGVRGELCIGGLGLARGYMNRPELTAEKFVWNPFSLGADAKLYRTGDLARFLPDGTIEYAGRIDEQVKVRGHRIELGEIEAVLTSSPLVSQAVVIVRRDANMEPRLVAYAVPLEAHDEPELRARLWDRMRRALPDYMVPSALMIMEALPLTPAGKVSRLSLPVPDDSSVEETPYTEPRTPLERQIADVWAAVLERDRVGVNDDFFALGGHSLLAMRVIARLGPVLPTRLTIRMLFEARTVAALAAILEPRSHEPAPHASSDRAIGRRVDRSRAPLTPVQERFWLGEQLEGSVAGSARFNVHVALELGSEPDLERLRNALRDLHARHEVLRTSIVATDGVPEQRIAERVDPVLKVSDLRGSALDAVERKALAIANSERAHAFQLAQAPLARFHLVQMAERSVLHAVLHHIIADGWGTRLLLSDLASLYAGTATERDPNTVDYADYATWLQAPEQQAAQERDLDYWREHLAGAPPLLELPTDHPRSADRASRAARLTTWVSPAVAARLRFEAYARGGTVFMTLLAAFQAFLGRLAGQDDVVIGAPVSGRLTPQEEQIAGCFINTVPIRTTIAPEASFSDLLAAVRTSALGAFDHQGLPFERLVRALAPERSLSHTPVFQVLFNMMNFPNATSEALGTVVAMQDDAAVTSKFDLTLYATDGGEHGIRLVATYDAGLFDEARMQEMMRQYVQLLTVCIDRPDLPVNAHSLVTPAAAAALPDPAAPLDDRWVGSVHALVSMQAVRSPQSAAVVDERGSWSYLQLDDAASRIAAALQAAGVGRGDVVGVYADRAGAIVPALVGVLRAGAAFLILDAAYPGARLAQYVNLASPSALLCLESAGVLPDELQVLVATPVIIVPATYAALKVSDIGGHAPAQGAAVMADDLAYVAFTSGTSGTPKGIRGRHGSLTHFVPWRASEFQLNERDRFSALSGLSHDPFHRDVFLPIQLGATVCVPAPEITTDGPRLTEWMREQAITVSHLTPGMTQLLAGTAPGLPALRWAFFVGDALQWSDIVRLRRAAPSVRVVNQYGATETQQALGYFVPMLPASGEVDRPADAFDVLPAGRGVPDTQLLVLNRAGALAGVGELGEVAIRSPHIALGYLEGADGAERFAVNPATKQARDRVYRTGDLGRFGVAGVVTLAGRADAQVKIRGFRVELGEVAAALRTQGAVRDAAVIARDDATLGRQLIGYIVMDGATPESLARVREALRERLPEYMVPSAIVPVPVIPLTPNGKLDRAALLKLDIGAPEHRGELVPPGTPVEAALVALWRSMLRQKRIGVMDSFFDLGGHSLLATQVAAKTGQVFRCTVPVRMLFEKPRIRDFATALIAREQKPGLTEQIACMVLKIDAMPEKELAPPRQAQRTTQDLA